MAQTPFLLLGVIVRMFKRTKILLLALVLIVTLSWYRKKPVEVLGETSSTHVEESNKQVSSLKDTSTFLGKIVVDLNNTGLDQSKIIKTRFNDAKELNEDVIGWLSISDFNLEYPVLYSSDNTEYLRKGVDGEYSMSGSIYLDAQCTVSGTPLKLLHGHNMLDSSMFSTLPEMLNWESLDDAPLVDYYDELGLREYKIFSIYTLNSKEETILINNYETLDSLIDLKNSYLDKSLIPVTKVSSSVELLLLDTCWYGESGNEHFLHCIVVCERIK